MKNHGLLNILLLALLIGAAAGVAEESAVTPEQIEADWLRQAELRLLQGTMTPAADAAGGCDGKITGAWGFHTNHQAQPWWEVDLGRETALGRVCVYNRCDAFGERAHRLRLMLSVDGVHYEQAYQHDGTAFLGKQDGKPLTIDLSGATARFVRIQLPGTDYLHLDEVEAYAPDQTENLAFRKSANQSSVSQWSANHDVGMTPLMDLASIAARGEQLLENLRELGADVSRHEAAFLECAERARALSENGGEAERAALQREMLWAIRRLTLSNPLLDFDEILFVKRAPTQFPHVSDQYYGWFARGGGGIHILSGFKGEQPRVRCITEGWPEGNFLRPDLSYDGTRVLFTWCRYYPHVAAIPDKTVRENIPEDAYYHLFEMNLDGSGVRQLTHGYYNDFDGRYLPNGDIVFTSTRKGIALQADADSAMATLRGVQPDSYVRCGGDCKRPVPVFTLHRMDGNGSRITAISAFENFEWTPAVNWDGQVLYARWDYIDRFNGHFMSLWSTRPDGGNGQLVYGNFTERPQCIFEARPIPGSTKLIFTATAHHSITGGALALLDRNLGSEFEAPLTRLTPEVCFPEIEGSPNTYYAGPWPLSEEHYLVSWSDRALPIHAYMEPGDKRNPPNASGIYLYDAFGNLNLLHRDPAISSETPMPIKARPRPFMLADQTNDEAEKQGAFLLQDVYAGMGGLPRGTIDRLRIVGVLPKVQPHMNQPVLGVSAEDTGKVILGTTPVESDGSAYFRIPSGMPVFFQALDQQGMAVRTMRTLTYVQPGQTLSCVGCHESRDSAPLVHKNVLAMRRPPDRLRPEPDGSWPLRYDVLVQPVLDRACVQCHQPGAADPQAARLDLRAPSSYDALLAYADNDLRTLAFEKNSSPVGDAPARKSRLLALITAEGGHAGVVLDDADVYRFQVWMDTYAHRQGAFSDEQEQQLIALRQQLNGAVLE